MQWFDFICVREQTGDNYVDQKILNQCCRLINHIQSKTLQAINLSISNTIIVRNTDYKCCLCCSAEWPSGQDQSCTTTSLNVPTAAFLCLFPSDPIGTEGGVKPEQFWGFLWLYLHWRWDMPLSAAFICPIQPSTDDLKKKSTLNPLCLFQDSMNFIGNLKSEWIHTWDNINTSAESNELNPHPA